MHRGGKRKTEQMRTARHCIALSSSKAASDLCKVSTFLPTLGVNVLMNYSLDAWNTLASYATYLSTLIFNVPLFVCLFTC